jgi:hypothetical protein
MTLDGFFLDCWPAFDRLARLMQRQMGTTVWGPILDHGVGFNFDCWQHYLETGDIDSLREPYPRLLRFARYLESIRRDDLMMPVEKHRRAQRVDSITGRSNFCGTNAARSICTSRG